MIKKDSAFLSLFLVAMAFMAMLASCKNQENGEIVNPDEINKAYVILNIEPVSTRSVKSSVITEKIKSARIVVIDTQNQVIEVNYKVSFADGDPLNAGSFQYYYTWETNPGEKKLYLIANEESVKDINFQTDANTSIPSGTPTTSLTDILDLPSYSKGSETGAEDLLNILDAIYFAPDYQPDELNNIYLPYVSVYDKTIDEDIRSDAWKLYVVPVATKFTFLFNNYRPVSVYINNITVSSINDSQFLFARVGKSDYTKDFNGFDGNTQTGLYWIDWLAMVSQASKQYQDFYPNLSFNTRFGWISDFEMPTESELNPFTFAKAKENTLGYEVPAIMDDENQVPGVTVFGPYYLPESKNLDSVTQQDENGATVIVSKQIYYLTLGLDQEINPDDVPPFEKENMYNLNSLFRNTDVTIVVNMYAGDIEIYAEISNWAEKSANGWVVKK